MLNLAEYQTTTKRLSDYLPWGFMVAPGVILNKDGSFQKSWHYRGPDLDSATPEELMAFTAQVNNVLKRFGSGWALFFEARRVPARHYPETINWPSPLARLIDEERKAAFADQGRYFESRHYLTLCWLPPEDRTAKMVGWLFEEEGRNAPQTAQTSHLETFISRTDEAVGLLASIFPEFDALSDDETLTYLHGTVSNSQSNVDAACTPAYLDHVLATEELTCGLSPMIGGRHLRVITLKSLAPMTEPGLLDALNRLGISYRWMTRFLPLDRAEAQRLMERNRRHWFAKRKSVLSLLKETLTNEPSQLVDSNAENKAAETDQALQDLGSDAVAFGYLTASIVIMHENASAADEMARAVLQVLQAQGLVAIEESLNAVDAFVGSLPGQCYANLRQPLIHTLNLAHLAPLSCIWAGPDHNAHLQAPPLMQVASDGCTPFRLVPHQGDVGHMMVVGPTGAGKSVLLSLIVAQFCRYDEAQVFFFDKGASARAMILGLGGAWADLAPDASEAFQPLRDIDDPEICQWALDWLLGLVTGEGEAPDPRQKEALWTALQNLSDAPADERTLTGLTTLVQDRELVEALTPFTLSGPFGQVFDGDKDQLSLSTLQGFELEDLMREPRLTVPVLTYLFKRIESAFDGRPSLLVLDEAWLFLDHPSFAGKIREWLKTLRKKNVSVIFATQSLADIAASAIAPALIESCPSRIFLPNPQARETQIRQLYETFGLNDRQIEIIATATPKRDYYFQARAGNRLFDLNLGEVALAFSGASSARDQADIDVLLPDHTDDFAAAWLQSRDLGWASDLWRRLATQQEATNDA